MYATEYSIFESRKPLAVRQFVARDVAGFVDNIFGQFMLATLPIEISSEMPSTGLLSRQFD